GSGTEGQLGLDNTNHQTTPTRAGDATNWSQISTGRSHTCATNTTGQLYCWGSGNSGQLGLDNTNYQNTPQAVTQPPVGTSRPNLASIDLTDLATPARFNAGIFSVEQNIPPIIFTNSGGNVQADGGAVTDSTPALPAGLRVERVLSGTAITCQIVGTPTTTANATTYTITASNTVGADSTPATVRFEVAITSPLIGDITNPQTYTEQIEIEPIIFTNTGLDVRSNGCTASPTLPTGLSLEVYNDSGTTTCRIIGTPQALSRRQTYSISAISSTGSTNSASVSIEVNSAPLSLASQISSGHSHTCAISADSKLYCWGSGEDGKLGLGNTNNQNTPTRVGDATNWSQISTGYRHTCAVNTNNELYCWGRGSEGRVGDATNWSQISTGESHTCATNTTGYLCCCGHRGLRHSRQGNPTRRSSDLRVGDATNWSQ
ncbi:MAG: hypothetical protein K8963_01170, partial [Proteobacteria bacterium]|nr:hypothetical protein [Pseudomonadota bacterium]